LKDQEIGGNVKRVKEAEQMKLKALEKACFGVCVKYERKWNILKHPATIASF